MESLLARLKMSKTNKRLKALTRLNYDLFQPESILPPAPATLYTKIREQAALQATSLLEPKVELSAELPSEAELYRMFEEYNWLYFDGRLSRIRIAYSNRMTSAGSYTPSRKMILIGRKYHELFPDEVIDTLKHEMIHVLHLKHDAKFKQEAARVGASLRARSHPSLHKPPRWVYFCPSCAREYPRQKRLRMASCGVCSKRGYDGRFKLKLKKT
jgi:predicted SprT family Zn-dependent metalloprotease